MVVSVAVGVHSQPSLAVDNKPIQIQSEVDHPEDRSITILNAEGVAGEVAPPPSAVPIEDSRQGSFNMENQLNESSTTMPFSTSDTNNPAGNGNGRDSPPTQKVRFSDGPALFQEQSQRQSNMNIPVSIQPAQSSPPPRPPSDGGYDAPSPSSILASKSKHNPNNNSASNRPSVFERLSKTETVASMHQKFSPNDQHERRIKRSTSAPPSLRAKNSRRGRGRHNMKSNYNINKSSNSHNHNKNKKRQVVPAEAVAPNLAEKIVQIASSFELFERLAEKHTALSKSRRRERTDTNYATKTKKKTKSHQKNCDRKRSSSLGRRSSHLHFMDGERGDAHRRRESRRSRRVEEALEDAFSIPSAGPPLEIEFSSRMKLVCSSKFVPEDGFEELDPFELGLNSSFTEYQAGSLSPKDFATEIMNSLLWRDLPPGMKWEVQKPLERELAMPIGEIGYSFMIEASGRRFVDDGDDEEEEDSQEVDDEEEELYVASATGNVTFLPDREIQVENYSCVHDVAE